MTDVACSCGVPGCPELGWPHEWDPIAAGDVCMAQPLPPHQIITLHEVDGHYVVTDHTALHKVSAPYARWGCGYGCLSCIEEASR